MSNLSDFMGGGSNGIHRRELFTTNGTWTKPANVLNGIVWVTMIGGGSEGRNASSTYDGGVGGGAVVRIPVDVTATGSVSITVGSGAAVGNSYTAGPSSFGAFLSVSGGAGAPPGYQITGDFPSRPTSRGSSDGGCGLSLGEGGETYGGGGRGSHTTSGTSFTDGFDGAVLVEWLEEA